MGWDATRNAPHAKVTRSNRVGYAGNAGAGTVASVTLAEGPLNYAKNRVSRQASRPRRVCGPRMMVMKKYREAISQERIVGNGNLKKFFLHFTRQVWPKLKRGLT